MADDSAAEPPPGTPGQRALGAMEIAVRRVREAAGAAPLPASPPPPRARPPANDFETPPSPGGDRPPRSSDRWLVRSVAVAAALVVAAAIALAVSVTGSSSPSPTVAGSPATGSSPPTTHRSGGGHGATSTSSTTTSTTVVAAAGPPVISSLSPASGSAGQAIVVAGANFLSSSGQIVATFNGQVAPTSCPAQNTCSVTVPASTSPSAQVVITTADGTSNALTFTYG